MCGSVYVCVEGGGGGVPEQAEVEPACPWTEQYLVQEFMWSLGCAQSSFMCVFTHTVY